MSHLDDLLSALVDGELDGAELDRANAHLAACPECQSEAAALRQLKNELRALGEAVTCPALDAMTLRLLALSSPAAAEPVPAQGPASPGAVPTRHLRRERN